MRIESVKRLSKAIRNLVGRFRRDESGNYLIIMGIAMPALIGTAGLGTEEGFWLYRHHLAQSAADAAAISAATGYSADPNTDVVTQARGVAAQYGFAGGGTNSVMVTVNKPPKSGKYTNSTNAVEVYVQETRPRLLSAIFGNQRVIIKSRAVALANGGLGCMLSLDKTASNAGNLQGNPVINLTNCTAYDNSNAAANALNVGGTASLNALSVYVTGGISGDANITTTRGIVTGANPIPDPYANTSYNSYAGCNYNNLSEHSSVTLNPGVYCNGLQLNAGAVVTLNPGVYYMDRGTLFINGGTTITGSGVTIVFTSSTGQHYATATINGGATVNLTAPTSGPTSGIVMFGDRNMPVGTTFSLNGGSGQGFGGAIYLPKAALAYAGGAAANTNCTEVIADTINFVGNSTLAVNCAGYGTKQIGNLTASLKE